MAAAVSKQGDIAKLKPTEARYRVSVENETDGGKKIGGLCLQVSPGGQKTFYYRYRFHGRAGECRVGVHDPTQFRLKEARALHSQLWHALAAGHDPALYLARQRHAEHRARAESCQHLFEEWIEHYAITESAKTRRRPSPRQVAKHKARWRLYCQSLQGFPFRDVERVQIVNLVDRVAKRGARGAGAPVEARHVLSIMRLMFHYAVNKGYIGSSPVASIEAGDTGASAGRVRERCLDTAELRRLWQAVDSAQAGREGLAASVFLSVHVATIIALLILTGQRVSEVSQMEWREVDFNDGTWTIPPERSKNRRAHIVHLSALAVDLLVAMKPVTGASQFVFESPQESKAGQPIRSDGVGKALARLQGIPATSNSPHDERAPLYGMERFTPHDLRRSAATAWGADLKIPPHIIEHMLNHTMPRLQQTYQRGEYLPERKAAFEAWGARVGSLIAQDPGGNVLVVSAHIRRS